MILAALEKLNAALLACEPVLARCPQRLFDPIQLLHTRLQAALKAHDAAQKEAKPIIFGRASVNRARQKSMHLVGGSAVKEEIIEDSANRPVFAFTALAILMQRGTEATGRRALFDAFNDVGVGTGKYPAFSQRISRLGSVGDGAGYISWPKDAKDAHLTVTKAGKDHYLALLNCFPSTLMTQELKKHLVDRFAKFLPDLKFSQSDVTRYTKMEEDLHTLDGSGIEGDGGSNAA